MLLLLHASVGLKIPNQQKFINYIVFQILTISMICIACNGLNVQCFLPVLVLVQLVVPHLCWKLFKMKTKRKSQVPGVHLVSLLIHPVMHLASWFVGDMQRVLPHASSTTKPGSGQLLTMMLSIV